MQQTKTAKPADVTPGFAIKLADDTALGSAMLICEDEEAIRYEPVGVASTIVEARELAQRHFLRRCNDGPDGDGLCPYIYKLWARGVDGPYCPAIEIDPMGWTSK